MEENKSKNTEKKRTLKGILNSIGEAGEVVAEFMAIGMLVGTIALSVTFPGESIKVPKGSNLSQIAQQYRTTWQRLEKRNKLENPDYIQEGQELIIYDQGPFGFFQEIYDRVNKY